VSQPNLAQFLTRQQNFNAVQPTTGWRVKQVGSWVHLIKRNTIFFLFLQSKLNYNYN